MCRDLNSQLLCERQRGDARELYTSDRDGEVERLLKLGAASHRQTYDPEDDFRVHEDPDGNLFCVVEKKQL